MSIWIVTIGNSDVQLTNNNHWSSLYKLVDGEKKAILEYCANLKKPPTEDEATELYPAPARALGLVYRTECLDEYGNDLAFPLLDTFIKEFPPESSERPTQVIVLLTDQTHIFTEDQKEYPYCPFWQDTVELQEILKRYFKKNLGILPRFDYIKPQPGNTEKPTVTPGVDNWEVMLKEVGKTLEKALSELLINREEETVYVSHQAGTPAISSALQFLTISKFKTVKFLVSNQSSQDDKPVSSHQVIDSSNYWRGLQIERAKKLIISGLPGAALELLKGIYGIKKIVTSEGETVISKLNNLVNLFNFKQADPSQSEFDPIRAIKRVRQALDLAEKFFESENYLPGVNVLAAAQETFLKAAIIYKLQQENKVIDGFPVCQLVKWDHQGLYLLSKNDLIKKGVSTAENSQTLSNELKFPDSKAISCNKEYKCFIPNDSRLREWLLHLENNFKEWPLMKWSCTHFRTRELDRRNQNLHNLLGVKKLDVIRYLLGNPDEPEIQSNIQPVGNPNRPKIKSNVPPVGNLNDPKIKSNVPPAQETFEKSEKKGNSLSVKDVIDVYSEYVKTPFQKALEQFGWNDQCLGYIPLQTQLEDLANSLDKQVEESDRTP
ncbi:hypothetical protein PN499_16700 [Kamptonema animale CS-326]|jgi:HEPN domain-containing protein|uniref:hypothetical protein n=1 Tax=Kamptonema animale TaxID=92934 RepID=UPI00232D3553|nr:hypothetical protein [Kamptonema animale]MDB9512830.1 hypothetical protein [Kamptonema animale CS-326]